MSFIVYKKIIKIYKTYNSGTGKSQLNYTTITAIGDGNGGIGVGKASNTNQNVSVFKSILKAKSNFFKISLKNNTILYPIVGKSCNCIIYFFPLNNIYKFSCGSYVRRLLDIAGIYNVTTKIYGSKNFYNILNSFLNAFLSFDKYFFIFKKRCI